MQWPLASMEMYSSGRRGAPAKGVGRVTGARVQISPSPPTKAHRKVCFFRWRRWRDLFLQNAGYRRRERERAKRRRWRMKRRRASEQIRSIGCAPRVRDRYDYICEVRRILLMQNPRYATRPCTLWVGCTPKGVLSLAEMDGLVLIKCRLPPAREGIYFISHCDRREQYFTIHKVNYFTFGVRRIFHLKNIVFMI